jgi:hypothetical protein
MKKKKIKVKVGSTKKPLGEQWEAPPFKWSVFMQEYERSMPGGSVFTYLVRTTHLDNDDARDRFQLALIGE